MARPQSVITARPVTSTRIFDWLGVNIPVVKQSRMTTYSLEVSVNNVVEVEVIQARCDIR